MRYVFFDLGDTLESGDVLRPGARQMLLDIAALRDDRGEPPKLGLISDFDDAATPADIPAIEEQYRQLLLRLGIEDLFRPFRAGGDALHTGRRPEAGSTDLPCGARQVRSARSLPRFDLRDREQGARARRACAGDARVAPQRARTA